MPGVAHQGDHHGAVGKRVVDLLGARLPDTHVVELDGSHAHHIESFERFIDVLETHLMAVSTI
jgi:hypothetical protein